MEKEEKEDQEMHQYPLRLEKYFFDRVNEMAKSQHRNLRGFFRMCIDKEWERYQSEKES